MQADERTVWCSKQDGKIMRLGHGLLSILVGKVRGSCGVKMRVVIRMVEVPVAVNEVLHWSIAQAIESLFESGPGGRNETIHHEFAVRAVEDHHGSARAVEQSDIVSKLLRFHGKGVEPVAHIRAGRPGKAIVVRTPAAEAWSNIAPPLVLLFRALFNGL
jgi:hypothetical protein